MLVSKTIWLKGLQLFTAHQSVNPFTLVTKAGLMLLILMAKFRKEVGGIAPTST